MVPYSTGRPGASFRPASHTNSYCTSVSSGESEFTPRIASISGRVTGCLYATIARVSRPGAGKAEAFGLVQAGDDGTVFGPGGDLIAPRDAAHLQAAKFVLAFEIVR